MKCNPISYNDNITKNTGFRIFNITCIIEKTFFCPMQFELKASHDWKAQKERVSFTK